MAEKTHLEIISNMTNIGDSGQDGFVSDWSELAKNKLRSRGISEKYINSEASAYILGKIVADLVDIGDLSQFSKEYIADLRINHPKREDKEAEGNV